MGLLVALSLGGRRGGNGGGDADLDEEFAGDGAWALLEELWAEEKDGGRWNFALSTAMKEMVGSEGVRLSKFCFYDEKLIEFVEQVASQPLPLVDSVFRLVLGRGDVSKASVKDLVPALFEVSSCLFGFDLRPCQLKLFLFRLPPATPPPTTLLPLLAPPSPPRSSNRPSSNLLSTSLRMRFVRQIRHRPSQPIDPHDARRDAGSDEVLASRFGDDRDGCGWWEIWRWRKVELGKDEAGSNGGVGGFDDCGEEARAGGRGVGESEFFARRVASLFTSPS